MSTEVSTIQQLQLAATQAAKVCAFQSIWLKHAKNDLKGAKGDRRISIRGDIQKLTEEYDEAKEASTQASKLVIAVASAAAASASAAAAAAASVPSVTPSAVVTRTSKRPAATPVPAPARTSKRHANEEPATPSAVVTPTSRLASLFATALVAIDEHAAASVAAPARTSKRLANEEPTTPSATAIESETESETELETKAPEANELYTLQYIKLRSIAKKIWFDVWFLGYPRSYPKSRADLLADGYDVRALNKVQRKGLKADKSVCGGLSLRSGLDIPASSFPSGGEIGDEALLSQDFETEIKVKFQYKNARCVPYAFLNVSEASKPKKALLMKTLDTGLCDLRELCDPVRKVFGKSLDHVDHDLDWLIEQKSGLHLAFDTIHCVGVDCKKRLIYDSSLSTCLKLCKEAFTFCDILKPEIRVIV